jgi:hypothetical protein
MTTPVLWAGFREPRGPISLGTELPPRNTDIKNRLQVKDENSFCCRFQGTWLCLWELSSPKNTDVKKCTEVKKDKNCWPLGFRERGGSVSLGTVIGNSGGMAGERERAEEGKRRARLSHHRPSSRVSLSLSGVLLLLDWPMSASDTVDGGVRRRGMQRAIFCHIDFGEEAAQIRTKVKDCWSFHTRRRE